MKFSKFRALDYKTDNDFESFWENNKYTKDIFEKSRLYAQNFKSFNDVDECVYRVDSSISESLTYKVYDAKQKFVICCFSSSDIIGTNEEALMWAHYADSSKGIRIDFNIDKKFQGFVKEVEYRGRELFNNDEELKEELDENKLENIICRKDEVWKYEKEYRAIFPRNNTVSGTGNVDSTFVPIDIKEITFGRGCGFSHDDNPNDGKAVENAKTYILKIASFIYEILKKNNSNMPKFYRYKDKYSSERVEIEENSLKVEIINKLESKRDSLQNEIGKLKKEIANMNKKGK